MAIQALYTWYACGVQEMDSKRLLRLYRQTLALYICSFMDCWFTAADPY